jgi:hypothetical protein
VQALYEGIVEETNQNLARFEKLKRVLHRFGRIFGRRRNHDSYLQSAAAWD